MSASFMAEKEAHRSAAAVHKAGEIDASTRILV
jgi:hypothetical protein